MKTTRQTAKTIITGLAVSLALAVPIHAQADQPMTMPGNSGPMAMGGMKGMGGGMKGMGGMMQMQAKMKAMQADMKAMDDELDALVVKMNQASGTGKTDAMAAVITKMAQQRKMTNQKMAAMQESMMHGMMGSMGGGMKMAHPMKMPK